ncbi:MAG: hypothetical protein IPN90_08960 [Elusimicrobia bacterium]|nr:hypothetical protein [Elusimicrobiota bacterium]
MKDAAKQLVQVGNALLDRTAKNREVRPLTESIAAELIQRLSKKSNELFMPSKI